MVPDVFYFVFIRISEHTQVLLPQSLADGFHWGITLNCLNNIKSNIAAGVATKTFCNLVLAGRFESNTPGDRIIKVGNGREEGGKVCLCDCVCMLERERERERTRKRVCV